LKEAEDQKDILFLDMVDSYRNLTLKHVAAYQWAVAECPKAGLWQGCQMVYFKTKNPDLGTFWRASEWKILVYFTAIWSSVFH
jgi:hypothetical protein